MADVNYFDLSLDELMNLEINSSTRSAKTRLTVPASATIYTQKQLNKLGLTSLDQLLNYVPGFQSTRRAASGHRYNMGVRGKNTGVEILLLIDGRRANNAFTGGIGSTLALIPLSWIKKIEFIRGPGSAIYGSNAFMGIINIITRQQENEFELFAGTENNRGGEIHSYKDWSQFSANFFAYHQKDDGQHYTFEDENGSKLTTQDPVENTDLQLTLRSEHWLLDIYHTSSEAWDYFISDNIGNDINRDEKEHTAINLSYENQFTESWRSEVHLRYQQGERKIVAQRSATGAFLTISQPASASPLITKAIIEDQESSFNWTHWHTLNSGDWLWGLEYRKPELIQGNNFSNFDVAALQQQAFPIASSNALDFKTTFSEPNSKGSSAAFLQYEGHLPQNLFLTLGLRYDHYQHIDNISPRAALVWQWNTRNALKILHGEAFRAPNISETDIINNSRVQSNPDLKPETIQTTELIWLHESKHTIFSLGTYYSQIKNNVIRGKLANGDDKETFTNGQSLELSGIESSLDFFWREHWHFNTQASHFFKLHQQPQKEADTLFSAQIIFSENQYNLSLHGYYHSEKEDQLADKSFITIPSYFILGGKWAYHFENKIEVYLQADNLLDEDYLGLTDNGQTTLNIPNKGRNYLLGTVISF
ncbi:MAG: TonB-dependent receptor [Pseudomonadales bacterium]|nr:TonB-dependent receptor [Pseudomonadales bacterium]